MLIGIILRNLLSKFIVYPSTFWKVAKTRQQKCILYPEDFALQIGSILFIRIYLDSLMLFWSLKTARGNLCIIIIICLLRFSKKLLFRFSFLCSYSEVFYLVNFKTNSIVNSSKIPILKILKFSTLNDVFCWILPVTIDEFHYFYSHAFQLTVLCNLNW